MSFDFALNQYFDSNQPSSTLAVNEQVKARWAQGERLLHMGFGESRFAVHEKLRTALRDHASQKSYLPSKGLPALCESVASYYSNKLGLDFNACQVSAG